ncbi:hypothetical protein L195_g026077 [Trifolium pratense]|uniref:Uncharacterized protein n=2 Tax=Trifolium pratense TaxID=57577 RepID=A0ACB0L0J8_TRIPR|nr:hypothetical protein L195_g026077 [Trifolium pratense]CAJ2661694.1 unnamed protein product [Trifolium pratense]
MENWQDQHDALKGEVAQLTGKLDKALELLLNLNKPAQPAVVETTLPTSHGGLSAPNAICPPLCFPIGYGPSGYLPTSIEVQPGPQNVQVPSVQQGFFSSQN